MLQLQTIGSNNINFNELYKKRKEKCEINQNKTKINNKIKDFNWILNYFKLNFN